MPAPIDVDLIEHRVAWMAEAAVETHALREVQSTNLLAVHHVGSTAVPGLAAKPILDLLLAVARLLILDADRGGLEAIGFEWWGEYGLPGRRYCTKKSPQTGRRAVQLHIFADGDKVIARHLAFRDYLRCRFDVACACEAEKRRCAALYPYDSHAYADGKSVWIQRVESDALAATYR